MIPRAHGVSELCVIIISLPFFVCAQVCHVSLDTVPRLVVCVGACFLHSVLACLLSLSHSFVVLFIRQYNAKKGERLAAREAAAAAAATPTKQPVPKPTKTTKNTKKKKKKKKPKKTTKGKAERRTIGTKRQADAVAVDATATEAAAQAAAATAAETAAASAREQSNTSTSTSSAAVVLGGGGDVAAAAPVAEGMLTLSVRWGPSHVDLEMKHWQALVALFVMFFALRRADDLALAVVGRIALWLFGRGRAD